MQIRRSAEKEEGNVWQQLMEVLPRARYFTFPSSCPPCVLYFIHSTTESQAVDALTFEIHTLIALNKTSKITGIHINKTNLYYSIFYSQMRLQMPLEKNAVTEKENQWSYTLYSILQTWGINTYISININIININNNISMNYLHQPGSHHTSLISRTLFLNYKGRQCLDLGIAFYELFSAERNVSPILTHSRKGVASSLIWLY